MPQDKFRKEYKQLTDSQKESMLKIKNKAEELDLLFDEINDPTMGREIALAKTKLEESIMWAVKGITV